ncbi:glycosyltransferase family 2 protein [Campylobacter lanienae]|uniref:glycosyltransferase family 2 protein n=1 Tax=Campylobacter lanienae TaxID=75658 RepID=UPI0024323BED|nr:glycosyltransferase family 2 protein [Campylobacter lanienae]MCI5540254.1 glycosyltransferase family 2 protein [Campylobacter lanienae]MDY5519429.1 glycosyltransferase family 2 protein [Campylobacter lanienae]
MDKISILCLSFNHQRFIADHIKSVLNQSFKDFELIIVDDCSTDDNVAQISQFNDPRIKLIRHEFNKGINATLNTAFENANGEYLMFLAGDDCLEINALDRIVKELDNSGDIVLYTGLMRIDINGNKIEPFNVEIKDRYKILNTIFMKQNCLLSPGMSMRKDIFAKYLYPLDTSMCMHQDTQIHVKLLLNIEPKFLDENLILYRFDDNVGNISGSFISYSRSEFETESLMDTFLNIDDVNLLKKIFAKEIDKTKLEPKIEYLEFFLGNMALLSSEWYRRIWGYHMIMRSYNTKAKAEALKKEYNFEFKDYLELINIVNEDSDAIKFMSKYQEDINALQELKNEVNKFRNKYKKYKKLSIALGGLSVVILVFLIIGVLLEIKNA